MSDYHVLEVSNKEHNAKVAFHVPVADVSNAAGVNYRTALRQYIPFISSVIPNHEIDFVAENADLTNGVIYEHAETVNFAATMTNGEKQTVIEDRFNELVIAIPTKLQRILKFWGLNNNV